MCRMKYKEAYENYKIIKKIFEKNNLKFELTGSMRRKKTDVGDIDIIIEGERDKVYNIIFKETDVKYIDEAGNFEIENGTKFQVIVVPKEEYTYTLWTSTGSKEHIKKIFEIYESNGKTISNFIESEEKIYNDMGLEYVKPEERFA